MDPGPQTVDTELSDEHLTTGRPPPQRAAIPANLPRPHCGNLYSYVFTFTRPTVASSDKH